MKEKSLASRGGPKPQQTTFLFLVIFFFFWSNIFNPRILSHHLCVCVWNMSEECRLCMACTYRCTSIPIDCVGFFMCVLCVRGVLMFCFSNLFSHWLLSELYSRSFNRFLECLPLLGRRKGGIYSCSARWGFLYFLPCVVCAVCVSLVGCTSCLFHRLSRSARVALTFELFLGFFQLFRFFLRLYHSGCVCILKD